MAGRIQVGGVRRTAWPWCMADVRDSRVFIKASKAVLGFRCVSSTKYFPIV